MRISVDIGGTFTDLVLEGDDGLLRLFKAPTVPSDPVQGIVDALTHAATGVGTTVGDLLASTTLFVHATTRGLNAVLTRTAARTAFLTTSGHPDVLVLREGGRDDPFDFTVQYPEPYVPRALTFEVPERILADGRVLEPLDAAAVVDICGRLAAAQVEAVGVCLLWSTVNPVHEQAVGRLLDEHLPGVPFTLSHELNPSLREYRRASSACIDASLKPLMAEYLRGLGTRLRSEGFAGRLVVVTSSGGVVDVGDVERAPIRSLNSGPSMAPVAGRAYAAADTGIADVIVADTGGTTYDVTLVRGGRIPWTRSAWVGPVFTGHMTGLPSIDVKSVGAGGGSIAWVDPGGLLAVGPHSAGSVPGPACYGRGGVDATVTDAAVVLGYIDPAAFSGGAMRLDEQAAVGAVRRSVGVPLGLDDLAAAEAIVQLTTEQMVRAIEDITLAQGVDPSNAVLVGGGGAAGLNAVAVAQRLGCRMLVIPAVGAALSAAGALMSDLTASYAATVYTTSDAFDTDPVNAALGLLVAQCREFVDRSGAAAGATTVELFAEARYPQQIWELEIPLRAQRFGGGFDVAQFVEDFHDVHAQVLGIADRVSPVEVVSWGARVRCALRDDEAPLAAHADQAGSKRSTRQAYFAGAGSVPTAVCSPAALTPGVVVEGPALIESAFTSVVLPPGSTCVRTEIGSLLIDPNGAGEPAASQTRVHAV
ncbi:MAG TPA: hydantoinase/oxoprolinase family protein [Ilumatobacter sp.]|nr:hydantoinase/oxoprolinase family protein [Ilumatobacter sp.]